MKKALLLYPSAITEIPHSLAILAAIFKEAKWDVRVSVSTFKKPLTNEDFLNVVDEYKPEVVGISMITIEVLKVYELIRELKKRGCEVWVGGVHATVCPEEVVRHGADIAIRNEGEETIREILQGKALNQISGITYMDDGKIVNNPRRPRIMDLTILPRPDFSVFDKDLFTIDDGMVRGMYRIYTSRGCPGRCTFCAWQVFDQKVSFLPIPEVIDEIKRRVDEYGITNFLIADDCLTTNKRHVTELCNEIVKITPRIKWQCQTRADFTTPELMKMMADAGCWLITVGAESGDPETLLKTKKRVTLQQNINAPIYAYEAGMKVQTNLMFGFPWETVKSLENGLDYIRKVWDATYFFSVSGSVVPFAGTDLYKEYSKSHGFKEYWLRPRYQNCGAQLYQNTLNPYAHSTFYQRNIYDDTYVQEDYFFNYSDEYKAKFVEVIFEVGRHNLEKLYPAQYAKRTAILGLSKISKSIYDVFPHLETTIGSWIHTRDRSLIEESRNAKRGVTRT
jgi:anaerobic magnesium-protoporphyrin IX monomethyl ester cyclase